MTINLQDLRSAVRNYVDMKVTVIVSQITPAVGNQLGPSEDFTFKVTAINADNANGGIPLKDVVWYVYVENDAVGKLYVPPAPMVARSSSSTTSSALNAGTLVKAMFLFPPTISGNYLSVADTDSINMKGKSGSAAGGGSTNIKCKIYADVDLDWLFPKDQDSSTGTRSLVVTG